MVLKATLQWGSLNKAVMCQSTMTALLRAAALLVNWAVTALLRVWDSLSTAVTALLREVPCFRVQYLTVHLVIYDSQGINLTESCTTKECRRTGTEMCSIVGNERRCIPDMIEDLLENIYFCDIITVSQQSRQNICFNVIENN